MSRNSQRKQQRRNYLKWMKKSIGKKINGKKFTQKDFEDLKIKFREEGNHLRLETLRESLELEKEKLAQKEGELRTKYQSEGLSDDEINKLIQEWTMNQKFWSKHKDISLDI